MAVPRTGGTSLAAAAPARLAVEQPAASGDLPVEAMSMFSAIAMAGGNENLGELLMLVAQGAAALLGVSRCAVYMRDEESGLFEGRCGYGAPVIDNAIRGSVCGQEGDGLTREIIATRGAVAVSNARRDPRPVRNAVLEWGVHSLVGAPIVHGDEVIGLIFLDDGRRQRAYTAGDLELLEIFATLVSNVIACACDAERLREETKALSGRNKGLQLTLAFGDRLAEVVAGGGGLADVAAAVADFTGKACGIYDSRGRRRAVATPPDVPDDRFPGLGPKLAAMPGVMEAVAAAKPGRATIVSTTGAAGHPQRLLLQRAADESPESGTILLQQGDAKRLHVLDAKVVRRAAAMVDLIVRAETNDAECLRTLTADLLLGRDDERIPERAERHSLDLDAPHVVCLFGARDGGGGCSPLSEASVADALMQATGEPARLLAPVGGRVAVVLGVDADVPASESIGDVKRTVGALARDAWRVGLSGPCREADDYAHALAEAEQALMACAERDQTAVAIDDLGPSTLLTSGIGAARAARFSRSIMAPLLDDPSSAGAVLIGTLETFFESGRNIRQTAQRLDVHENTIRYRLGSIQRRTGFDVAGDPRDELAVQLALHLMRNPPDDSA